MPNASITKKNTEDSPRAGAILGVLCLSGLHFFLGSLFFCEEHLDILLCFHQLLHLIPRLAIGRIGSFLLRKQCGVFCVQLFYLWQFFQSGFVKSGFCRLVQCNLLPMFFQKLLAVPSLTVGRSRFCKKIMSLTTSVPALARNALFGRRIAPSRSARSAMCLRAVLSLLSMV